MDDGRGYQAKRPPISEYLQIRDCRYHVRRWGDPRGPIVVMLHGWLDMSATWQFVVDAMSCEWNIVAPDWSGFGASGSRTGAYGYADYLADLDALLDHYTPGAPAHALIGHSMGGNTAGLFAGLRPDRQLRLATIEGFGPIPPLDAEAERKRVIGWLDGVRAGGRRSVFADYEQLAARLRKQNSRLLLDRSIFLACSFGRPAAGGGVELAADPAHQRQIGQPRVNGDFYRACWRAFPGPALWIRGNQSPIARAFDSHAEGPAAYREALASFRQLRELNVEEAAHNVQHDQPEQVAEALEALLRTPV